MGGHTLVEIHRWPFIGGHTWVGRIEPVFIFMLQASAGCDEGFPWLVTIGVFRGLQRGGASVRCDEVLPCVATQRQNRWERQGVSQVSLPPQFLLFAIIIDFRDHQVSPSSSRFVKFTWNLKGHSRYLQGTSRVQVEPNCVHLDPNLDLTT